MPEGRFKYGHSIRKVTSRNVSFAKYEKVSSRGTNWNTSLRSVVYENIGKTIIQTRW